MAARRCRAGAAQDVTVGYCFDQPRSNVQWVAFDQRMRELGYVEGQNLAVEYLNVREHPDRFDEAVKELLRRKVDIMIGQNEEAGVKAAMAATSTLPIVMIAISFDPVERGIVTSIA